MQEKRPLPASGKKLKVEALNAAARPDTESPHPHDDFTEMERRVEALAAGVAWLELTLRALEKTSHRDRGEAMSRGRRMIDTGREPSPLDRYNDVSERSVSAAAGALALRHPGPA
jgi:hypothetical protein